MMKRLAPALFFSLLFYFSGAQSVRIIVPKQPVVYGNAFQIQYVITNPADFLSLEPPAFDSLRLVSGPNHYRGNATIDGKLQPIENITYTLVPTKIGSLVLKGATAKFRNAAEQRSDEVTISVLPQFNASFTSRSTYTDHELYAPASQADRDRLIEDNLFIRTEVSRRSCFIGEPVVVTFKLYSRLQSTSEVINAPSLYGFSVMDVLNINEAHQAVETIRGKVFNTSILRKLQLYPEQSGTLVIDEMQLQNEIEFSDSSNRKFKVEKQMASSPVQIKVNPLPSNKPEEFTGAVGKFVIEARVEPTSIASLQQGKLRVLIKGQGNFIQFAPPLLHWPKSLDVFDPVVTDNININASPVEGSREYEYGFTTHVPAPYSLPPVSFSFFDPVARKYKTVSTDSIYFEVLPATTSMERRMTKASGSWAGSAWILLLFLAGAVAAFFFWLMKKKKKPPVPEEVAKPIAPYSGKMQAMEIDQFSGKQTCHAIQKLLLEAVRGLPLTSDQEAALRSIKEDCQLLGYSEMDGEDRKEEIRKRATLFLQQLGL